MRITRKLTIVGAFISTIASAALVSRAVTFTDGTVLFANDLSTEFNNIINGVNTINDDNITASANITASKLSPVLAGEGIARNGTTAALDINYDNTMFGVTSDVLKLKDGGIATAKLADGSVTGAKLNSNVGDGVTIALSTAQLIVVNSGISTAKIADLAVTTPKIADGAVTHAKLFAANYVLASDDSGSYSTTSASYTGITNQILSITTVGRPVTIGFKTNSGGFIGSGLSGDAICQIKFTRNGVTIDEPTVRALQLPPSSASSFDSTVTAGTHTYEVFMKRNSGSGSCQAFEAQMYVIENK